MQAATTTCDRIKCDQPAKYKITYDCDQVICICQNDYDFVDENGHAVFKENTVKVEVLEAVA